MKRDPRDQLMDAIGEINDLTIQSARETLRRAFPWRTVSLAAACLALAVLAAAVLPTFRKASPGDDPTPPSPGTHDGETKNLFALALAVYPETTPHPSEADWAKGDAYANGISEQWWAAREARRENAAVYTGALDGYLRATAPVFLASEKRENRVYSPLNVYLALSMLAELTDGDSRAQILTLLGAPDVETVRQRAKALWEAHHQDDGLTTSVLAASLWLAEDLSFVPETLETLARDYYASSYQGAMGSPELDAALQAWLNDQTGGLLQEQAGQIQLQPETVLALATTVYFRTRWNEPFDDVATAPDTFRAPDGDVTCDFMHDYKVLRTVYTGDGFLALPVPLQDGAAMWLLLPEEGVSPEELVQRGTAMDFLLSDKDACRQGNYLVNLSLPKFDVSSSVDLLPGLRALGVTDVLDDARSDFSPLTPTTGRYLSQCNHAARVAVDEEGVTAAAFTVIGVCGSALPQGEELDFTVDRPFFFAVTGEDGLPLFTGVVNTPAAG